MKTSIYQLSLSRNSCIMSFFSFFVAALVTSASARSIVLEQVHALPTNWKESDAAVEPTREVEFSIALKQPKVDIPSLIAQGGKHLTRDQVRALRAPDQASVDGVTKWLSAENISDVKVEHDMINVRTTVAEAEKLLETKFSHYVYDGKRSKLRAREYSVPEDLVEAISFIHPIVNFMRPEGVTTSVPKHAERIARIQRSRVSRATAAKKDPCGDFIYPECIKHLYNITYKSPDRNSPVRFGVAGYVQQDVVESDLAYYLKTYANITDYRFKVETVSGGQHPQKDAGIEAMLDVDWALAIGYPAAVTYYATGGLGQEIGEDGKPVTGTADDNEPFLDLINALLEKPDDEVPHVLSVSYGDEEPSVPLEYAKRVCDAYGLLTKRGTSIIHSSGDGGMAGPQPGNCKTHDGKETNIAMPVFPATCPWVTSVGGTNYLNDAEGVDHIDRAPMPGDEMSSGGFSSYFDRPAWQEEAVSVYIKAQLGYMTGYYNPKGRAFPDVALVCELFTMWRNNQWDSVSGTSGSAPIFAALIALANDARLRAGKQSIGFLNEIFYSKKGVAAFTDVINGTSGSCPFTDRGWTARRGWDAVTGLGEPLQSQSLIDLLFAA